MIGWQKGLQVTSTDEHSCHWSGKLSANDTQLISLTNVSERTIVQTRSSKTSNTTILDVNMLVNRDAQWRWQPQLANVTTDIRCYKVEGAYTILSFHIKHIPQVRTAMTLVIFWFWFWRYSTRGPAYLTFKSIFHLALNLF